MSFTDKMINPETGHVIKIGGQTYNNLVKRQVIVPKEIHIVEGVKKIKVDVEPASSEITREQKRAYLTIKKAKENAKLRDAKSIKYEARIKELELELAKAELKEINKAKKKDNRKLAKAKEKVIKKPKLILPSSSDESSESSASISSGSSDDDSIDESSS